MIEELQSRGSAWNNYYLNNYKTKEEMLDIIYELNQPFGDMGAVVGSYVSWVPAFDNYDGSEKFWCIFEKTRATEELATLLKWEPNQGGCRDSMVSSAYIWSVSAYYSLLVVGGNELQPA